MKISHISNGCQKDCQLAEPTYYRSLHAVANRIAKKHLRIGSLELLAGGTSLIWPSDYLLVYPDLHLSHEVVLHHDLLSPNGRDNLLRQIVEELDSNNSNIIALHLKLWAVLTTHDLSCLKAVLCRAKIPLPPCLLSSLLIHALQHFYVDGVTVLLEHGAPVKIGLEFCRTYWDYMGHHIGGWDMLHAKLLNRHSAMLQICINASDNPAFLQAFPLQKAGQLALRGATGPALALVEAASSDSFSFKTVSTLRTRPWENFLNMSPEELQLSPFAAIHQLLASSGAMMLEDPSKIVAGAARILHFALLPLLRAGASFLPDPLEEDPSLVFDCYGALLDDEFNILSCLWGRTGVISQMLLEARQSGQLNVAKMLRQMAADQQRQSVQRLADFARRQFPRRLQLTCRTAILRQLPRGVKARTTAIDQMNLPQCLNDFLQYREFDLLPGALSGFQKNQ